MGTPASVPAAGFYVTGGTLRADSPSYIKRRADEDLHDSLRAGEYCYVLTSRQMGKSSLMARAAYRLRTDGARAAVLDLAGVGLNLSVEQWYDGLLVRLGQQLGMEDELEDFWFANEQLGPLQRWMESIRRAIQHDQARPLTIFVDETDVVQSLPFSPDEFFAGIRECHTRRVEDPDFDRLTFCLIGVATPTDLVRDPRLTPFNIGRRIELEDFTDKEAAPLAEGLHNDEELGERLLGRVLHWTEGHPYLTQRLCHSVSSSGAQSEADVDTVCAETFFLPGASARDPNLMFVRDQLLRRGDSVGPLLTLYRRIWEQASVVDDDLDPVVALLHLSGLVRSDDGRMKVRNRIYTQVFDGDWIEAHTPGAELARVQAASQSVVLLASLAASQQQRIQELEKWLDQALATSGDIDAGFGSLDAQIVRPEQLRQLEFDVAESRRRLYQLAQSHLLLSDRGAPLDVLTAADLARPISVPIDIAIYVQGVLRVHLAITASPDASVACVQSCYAGVVEVNGLLLRPGVASPLSAGDVVTAGAFSAETEARDGRLVLSARADGCIAVSTRTVGGTARLTVAGPLDRHPHRAGETIRVPTNGGAGVRLGRDEGFERDTPNDVALYHPSVAPVHAIITPNAVSATSTYRVEAVEGSVEVNRTRLSPGDTLSAAPIGSTLAVGAVSLRPVPTDDPTCALALQMVGDS